MRFYTTFMYVCMYIEVCEIKFNVVNSLKVFILFKLQLNLTNFEYKLDAELILK